MNYLISIIVLIGTVIFWENGFEAIVIGMFAFWMVTILYEIL